VILSFKWNSLLLAVDLSQLFVGGSAKFVLHWENSWKDKKFFLKCCFWVFPSEYNNSLGNYHLDYVPNYPLDSLSSIIKIRNTGREQPGVPK
jgi:hypothetical protein